MIIKGLRTLCFQTVGRISYRGLRIHAEYFSKDLIQSKRSNVTIHINCTSLLFNGSEHHFSTHPRSVGSGHDGIQKSADNGFNKQAGDILDFANHSLVFQHKSNWELSRGLFVLYVCGIDVLVAHSYKLFRTGERILGRKVLGVILSPFYWHFVAGDSEKEMEAAAKALADVNLNLMIAPMIETDVGEGYQMKDQYAQNAEKTLHLIEVAGRQRRGDVPSICQTKHTAQLSADVLSEMSTAYTSLSVPQRTEAVVSLARAMMVTDNDSSKPLYSHLAHLKLNLKVEQELFAALPRFRRIGERCLENNVVLAVDAEYTYTNPAISFITLAMMVNFNHSRPAIWNTYQALLKSTGEWLEHDLEMANRLNMKFGAKIVRGAYLDKERLLSQEQGYPDPTNPSYEATGKCYDCLVARLGLEVSKNSESFNLMVASHNEASIRRGVTLLESLTQKPKNGSFVFGQVYGMAENISVPLAAAGYNVYKSIPYGNMGEVLPYLSRRASENRAVFKGVRRERNLLTKQLITRFRPRVNMK